MNPFEKFIHDHEKEGQFDSTGAFTINFSRAREKLAKFRLTDPHELILKFVQAANLAADSIEITLGKEFSVKLVGWDQTLTCQRIIERLTSVTFGQSDDALTPLGVALSTLVDLADGKLTLEHIDPTTQERRQLFFGATLEQRVTALNESATDSVLEVSWPKSAALDGHRFRALLAERCHFTTVPVLVDREPLKPKPLDSPGHHRDSYFPENYLLAQRLYLARDAEPPYYLDRFADDDGRRDAEHTALFKLSVDFNPMSLIWLSKAGVLVEQKQFNLRVPGVVGIVTADRVPTDISGSAFIDGADLDHLKKWLRRTVPELIPPARKAGKEFHLPGQPPSKQGRALITQKLLKAALSHPLR